MRVNVEREVDLNSLIKQLDNKSQTNPDGMTEYKVMVDKQLLRDAHDVIVQFKKEAIERVIKDMERIVKRKYTT